VSYLYNLISFRGSNSAGPDTEYRVRGGTQAIPLRIAEQIKSNDDDSTILFQSPVDKIERIIPNDENDSMYYHVTTRDGRTYMSKTILVTGSPATLHNIQFLPNTNNVDDDDDDDDENSSSLLPKIQQDLLSPQNSPMGQCHKFLAIFHRGPWWRKYGLQGDILASGGLPPELSVPVPSWKNDTNQAKEWLPLFSYCFDVSPYSQTYGVLGCFVEGLAYDKFHTMTLEEQKDAMTDFLRLSFDELVDGASDTSNSPIWMPDDFVAGDWGPDTNFIGGAYTRYVRWHGRPCMVEKVHLFSFCLYTVRMPLLSLCVIYMVSYSYAIVTFHPGY
jgi:hypothetical protein